MADYARRPIRYTTESERLAKIREAALALVAAANEDHIGTRVIPQGTAKKVVDRALKGTREQAFSIRKNKALSEISAFITLYQRNKIVGRYASHTDLLPIAHPQSSKAHNLSTTDLLRAKARWYTDDTAIADDTVRSLVASALTSIRNTPEHAYATARLASLPSGQVPRYTLLASYSGGNSWAARSARARVQRRDRKGRFAWMGGGFSFKGMFNGGAFNFLGRVVGWGDGNSAWVELPNAAIVKVDVSKGEAIKAVIDPPNAGKDWQPDSTSIESKDDFVDVSSMEVRKAPPGFSEDKDYTGPNADVKRYYGQRLDYGTKYTDDAYDVIVFDTPNQYAADEFEVAQQREGEGKDVVTRGRGENGGLNPNRPVMFVRRRNDEYDDMDFAVVQSWSDVQLIIQEDEPKYKKGEPPTPTADGFQDKEEGTEYSPEDLKPGEPARPAPTPPSAPEPEPAPEPEAPATPKVRRVAPGDTVTDEDIENLPVNEDTRQKAVVKQGSKFYVAESNDFYEIDPDTAEDRIPSKVRNENGFVTPVRPQPRGDFELVQLPGYDENAPGTGIVESVQLNKPREGDFIKTKDGEWTKVVKLDRERRKRPSDKAGRRPMTDETFDYTYENGDGHTAETTNGGLGFDQGKERLEIVRAADLAEEPTPEPEAAPEAPEAEAPEAPSGLGPSVSAEEIQNIKEQSMLDHIKEQGRFPLPRGARSSGSAGNTTDIAEGAKRDYNKVYDLLKERDPEFTEKYPDFDAFWDKVQEYGVDDKSRAYDSSVPSDETENVIPEEMKQFNRAYAEAVLGMDPDGEITLYRNAINNPANTKQAGTGYWSTDKDFAQDYGATKDKVGGLNGFYEGKFRPDQIGGMLGYSKAEDEFAVTIGPDVAAEDGRVAKIAEISPPKLPDFLLNHTPEGSKFTLGEDLESNRRTGGSAFRFNALAGSMDFSKIDNNPMGDGKLQDFLDANGLTVDEFRGRYDALYGDGAYAESKEAGNNPSFQELQKSFIQDEDGNWFLDVARIVNPNDNTLVTPSYGDGDPETWKNDKFDAKMKMLGLIQDITGQEFMSERKYDEPEADDRVEEAPEAEAPEVPPTEPPTPEETPEDPEPEGEYTPDELALGYMADKVNDGEYMIPGDDTGPAMIITQQPDGKWVVTSFDSSPSGEDTRESDIGVYDTAEEAFDVANINRVGGPVDFSEKQKRPKKKKRHLPKRRPLQRASTQSILLRSGSQRGLPRIKSHLTSQTTPLSWLSATVKTSSGRHCVRVLREHLRSQPLVSGSSDLTMEMKLYLSKQYSTLSSSRAGML